MVSQSVAGGRVTDEGQNWPPEDQKSDYPEEAEALGSWRAGPFVIGSVEGVNDELSKVVCSFKATKYELGILARHYLDERHDLYYLYRCRGEIGSGSSRIHAFAGRRLATIEKRLGEPDFKKMTSQTEEKWEKIFAELDEDERACKNYGRDDHAHVYCVLERDEDERVSQLGKRWPDLSQEKLKQIVMHEPFIGMTTEQAEEALLGQAFPHRLKVVIEADTVQTWKIIHQERQLDTPDSLERPRSVIWLLTFKDGKLITFSDA